MPEGLHSFLSSVVGIEISRIIIAAGVEKAVV